MVPREFQQDLNEKSLSAVPSIASNSSIRPSTCNQSQIDQHSIAQQFAYQLQSRHYAPLSFRNAESSSLQPNKSAARKETEEKQPPMSESSSSVPISRTILLNRQSEEVRTEPVKKQLDVGPFRKANRRSEDIDLMQAGRPNKQNIPRPDPPLNYEQEYMIYRKKYEQERLKNKQLKQKLINIQEALKNIRTK